MTPEEIRSNPIAAKAYEAGFRDGVRSVAATPPTGWQLVPIEPTMEMLHAATMEVPTWDDEASRRKYAAMLRAAPVQSFDITAMRSALEDIARQHKTDEMCEAEVDGADFENAYDIIIGRARTALSVPRPDGGRMCPYSQEPCATTSHPSQVPRPDGDEVEAVADFIRSYRIAKARVEELTRPDRRNLKVGELPESTVQALREAVSRPDQREYDPDVAPCDDAEFGMKP